MPDTLQQGLALQRLVLGIKLDRVTATLPASTSAGLFTITGGRIVLTSIVGEVTVIIQVQICATKLISTPTIGTAVDMCATVDISGKEVGALFGITGLPSDAAVMTNAGLAPRMYRELILPIGTINLNTAATNTGSMKWSITYYPLDAGASVAVV